MIARRKTKAGCIRDFVSETSVIEHTEAGGKGYRKRILQMTAFGHDY
jgi:hypothetical protein